MVRKLAPRDEGKPLVTTGGDVVGVLERIDAEAAYVRPRPGLLTGYGSWIGGSMDDVESFRLDETAVRGVESDCVVIGTDAAERSRPQRIE